MADRKEVQKSNPERNRNAGSVEKGSRTPGQEKDAKGGQQAQASQDSKKPGVAGNKNQAIPNPELPEGSEPAWNPTRDSAQQENDDRRQGGRQEENQDPNRNRATGTEAPNRSERSGESFEQTGSRRRDEDR